jgi:hypothetical protein
MFLSWLKSDEAWQSLPAPGRSAGIDPAQCPGAQTTPAVPAEMLIKHQEGLMMNSSAVAILRSAGLRLASKARCRK